MGHLPCKGWWEQDGYGRQYMEGLLLSLEGGRISGSGMDVVGPFTFEGTLGGDNSVAMTKQYLGGHAVTYRGRYDGEHRLWGQWHLHALQGPWAIWLKDTSEEDEAEKAEAAVEAPIEAETTAG